MILTILEVLYVISLANARALAVLPTGRLNTKPFITISGAREDKRRLLSIFRKVF